jgi:AraC-like DNA-binding protein
VLHLLSKFATNVGIDFDKICDDAGIELSLFENLEERISAKRFLPVWDKAIQLTGDRNFGLHFGKELANNYPGGNILISMMVNSPTIGDALNIFCRYHNLMEDAIQPEIKVEGDFAFLSWKFMIPGVKIPRQNAESLLCAAMYILRYISENRLTPVAVRFGHSRPRDILEHKEIFNSPLQFDQAENELVLDRAVLDGPIFLASRELFDTLEQLAGNRLNKIYASDSWSKKVIQTIGALLSSGEKSDIDTVAVNLAVSVRSLQNKLKDEKTTFTQILDQIRKQAALDYLKQPDITICDIAFLLGFSEQSAFNHAFKRWTGSTPKQHRKKDKKISKRSL